MDSPGITVEGEPEDDDDDLIASPNLETDYFTQAAHQIRSKSIKTISQTNSSKRVWNSANKKIILV